MFDFNKVIKILSKEEIQRIIKVLEEELKQRERKNNFEFYFTASKVTRKYHPYVARLIWNGNKIQRQFFNFKRSYHKDGTVSVHGVYHAPAGAVLEKRFNEGGKEWVLVTIDGKHKEFTFDEEGKQIIEDYLKGNLSLDEVETKLDEKEIDKIFKE